jgi:multidrug efflux pump subunit AcrA (membrane-fusion protein)
MRRDVWGSRSAAALVAIALAACKGGGDGKAQLPPPTGAGAAPLPALPQVDEPGGGAGTTATAGDDRATGTLVAHAEAQLGPTMSGVIAKIAVKEGDRVKKGEVLFRLDTRDALLRREQARAQLEAAKVAFKAARTEYDRTKMMVAENAVNRAAWDQVEARYEAARWACSRPRWP